MKLPTLDEHQRNYLGVMATIAALTAIAILMAATGCAAGGGFGDLFGTASTTARDEVTRSDPIRLALSPFCLVGTVSILAGVLLLFITRLSRGWIPLFLGIGLCLLAWIVAVWAKVILWLLVPLAALIGIYHLWYIPRGRRLWKANGPGWFSGLVTPWRSRSGAGPDA